MGSDATSGSIAHESLIATPRLDLHCISLDEMMHAARTPDPFSGRSFTNPSGIFAHADGLHAHRIEDVRRHPQNIRWYYRVIVERASNVAVGSISFHGAPDARGMLEVGVTIAAQARNRGYATEALRGFWTWAAKEPDVRFLRYTVSPENHASIAIIRKFGFAQIGEQLDEVDGLELVFESPTNAFHGRKPVL